MANTGIEYGLLERPPFFQSVILAFQQILVVCIYLVLISIVANKSHASVQISSMMISWGLISMGIATLLQILHKGPIGSGFLVASCPSITFFFVSCEAVKIGGLSLMYGMTLFSGVCIVILSFFIKKLRFILTPTVSGVVFCAIGLSIGLLAIEDVLKFFYAAGDHGLILHLSLFLITLIAIIFFSVWGKGILRLASIMLGLVVGSLIAIPMHIYHSKNILSLVNSPWFFIPSLGHVSYSFQPHLMIIFFIIALAALLRTMGVVTMAQQVNDKNWSKADSVTIRKGVIADGVSVFISGLLGTIPVGVSPSSVGVSRACHASSRVIGYFVGIILILLGFIPKISHLIMLLPLSVLAGGLVVAASIIFSSGVRLITINPASMRQTFSISLPLFLGLTPQVFPTFFKSLPHSLHFIVTTMQISMSILVIVLTTIFYLGSDNKLKIKIDNEIMNKSGLKKLMLGLSVDKYLAGKVNQALFELIREIYSVNEDSNIQLSVRYDQVRLAFDISYIGALPRFDSVKAPNHNFSCDDSVLIESLNNLFNEVRPDHIEFKKDKEGAVNIQIIFDC